MTTFFWNKHVHLWIPRVSIENDKMTESKPEQYYAKGKEAFVDNISIIVPAAKVVVVFGEILPVHLAVAVSFPKWNEPQPREC